MKKLLLLPICAILLLCLAGCSVIAGILPVREYKGAPLTSLSYETVDYMGGHTTTFIFDFEENTVTKTELAPYLEEGEQESTEHICDFTEESERELINKLYSYGLFNIREKYEPLAPVMDGGGWTLEIDYSDGTKKRSTGSNAGPDTVFSNCAIPFYDICGYGVVGYVPSSYYSPPRVDFSVGYEYKNNFYTGNTSLTVRQGNYLWNEHSKSGANLYELATEDCESRLLKSGEYILSLYTANYGRDYQRFKECVVMSYAIDPELSDGREVLCKGWFDQIDIPLELDRLYVVTLKFDNGDYAEYVFSTAALDQKIHYGEYSYNIYAKGKSALTVNSDGSFSLAPFNYFEEGDRQQGEATEPLAGKWSFETIDGEEFLVLTAEDGGKLVLDYCAKALFLDKERSTLELYKYNLDGDSNEEGGKVSFNKN